MRLPRFLGLGRVWDYLFDSWKVRFAKLGLSHSGAERQAPRTMLQFASLEDRVVPARPLPYPFIFAGVGSGSPSEVKAYNAETGDLLYTRTPYDSGFTGGVLVAAGDIDRDGLPDLVAAPGPGGGPHVKVYSGTTGNLLRSFFAYDQGFSGGVSVAMGDVNGDGVSDIITAAGAGGGPHVKVFSGVNNELLASFYAYASEFTGGVTIAAADFTGDQKADLLVGAGAGGGPHVKIFDLSKSSSTPMESFYAFESTFTGGISVGTDFLTGDVTGDGHDDILVGRGVGAASQVRVFDGVTREIVRDFSPFGSKMTNGSHVAAAFVNDDEYADIVVGTGSGVTATIKVFDGLTGDELASPLGSYTPFGPLYTGGVYVAASNDPPLVPPPPSLTTPVLKLSVNPAAIADASLPFSLLTRVIGNSPGPAPTGTVTWTATLIGSSPPALTSLGSASLSSISTSSSEASTTATAGVPSKGQYTVEASYSGDSTYGALSISTTVSVGEQESRPGGASDDSPSDGLVDNLMSSNNGGLTRMTGGVDDRGIVSVRLLDGIDGVGTDDLVASPVTWSNEGLYGDNTVGGGTYQNNLGYLKDSGAGNGTIAVVSSSGSSVNFTLSGGSYLPQFGSAMTLTLDNTAHEFTVTNADGSKAVYYDLSVSVAANLRGKVKSRTDTSGKTTAVTSWDGSGRPLGLETTDSATGVAEKLVYTYNGGGQIDTITRQRKPSGGSYVTIRTTTLSYATPSGASQPSLVSTSEQDGSSNVLGETYNRYYASGSSTGYPGALKYHLGESSTARLKQAYSGTALSALSDAQVAVYADNAFEYDASHRVTKVVTSAAGYGVCNGDQGTFNYAYATNLGYASAVIAGGSLVNVWRTKISETRDDGTVSTKYVNKNGQTMLSAVYNPNTSQTWPSFTRYFDDGRIAFTADSSGINGFDETKDDLVDYTTGVGTNAIYLNDTSGLFTSYFYGTSTTATDSTAGNVTGYVKSVTIQKGEYTSYVTQSDVTYLSRTTGAVVSYHPVSSTQYRNTDGTGGQTTSTAYTWQSSTQQAASVVTTLPTVTTTQNGPNSATASTVVMDNQGRVIWSKDAAGVLGYTAYDSATGAVVKSIADVNTANTSDFANLPSGWSTPSGAGKHLISLAEVDALGRTTKSTDPLGQITYTVYNDITKEVRVYAGWNTGTNTPTGPTKVFRDDWANGYSESLTMSATPTVSGGRPTGTESVSSIESLSRSYRNEAGQTTYTDNYFNLSGLTYSTGTTLGTLNTHFYRTQQSYDKKGAVNRTVTNAGTITRMEYDLLGRNTSVWVGTDDTPTTGVWSTTNLTGTNMVKVSELEYDNGGVGDSNITKQTQFPSGSTNPRVTQTWYDWRNRPVGTKSGVESTESTSVNRPLAYTEYDNLSEVISSERYDGDTVTLTDSNNDGVPDRPSSSLLRAKSLATYDELGRAYKNETYAVDPSSGSVSSYALTSQSWFDVRGQVIKVSAPGGLVQKTAYDSLGRVTTQYVTDGGGDTGWSDADDVTGDIVLSQSEAQYDANSQVLMSTSRERFHDASGTGALGTPTTGIAARVSYSTSYYDLGGRLTDSVTVGSNTGSSYTRPGTVPTRSDSVLVSSVQYDSAGRQWKTIDPKGLESRTSYDAAGRATKTIENYVDGTPSNADDKTTEYTYSSSGMTSLTAKLAGGGGGQTTEWVYGVTQAGGSGIDSNDVVGKTRWPDASTGASSATEQETVLVNALGQPLVTTDRNGNSHTLAYDILGRVVSDTVTTLGSGVDGSVRRVETAYDSQGNAYLFTNYDATTGGSIVTQTQRAFNGLGQLTQEWQSRGAAVNTSTSPSVQYAYSTLDSNNRSRLTSVTYPSGYVLTYNYSSGLNSSVSRLSSLTDTGGTLESYDYLGLGTVVRRAHSTPGVDLTYIGTGTGAGGDKYVGLDSFGRVVDQNWDKSGTSQDRFTYTYDRDGNRTAKGNSVNSAYSEAYTYDGLNQLSSSNRNSGARTQSWDYDAVGNWNSVTTNGTAQTRSANKQNEITSVSGSTTPTYDANGNMTKDETAKQYTYDAWNRMKVVKDSGGTTLKTYTYDSLNRRVAETVSGTTTDLLYSADWQVLEERVSGTTKARNVWSPVYVDAMILRDRDADNNSGTGTNGLEERLYVQQDANFNVTSLLNTSGTVVERFVYDAFGTPTVLDGSWGARGTSSYGWVYLHQGGRLDATSGLYHFRNRDYSPTLGRWVTMDPIRFAARDVNLYRTDANNSVNKLDPIGLEDFRWDPRYGWVIGGPGMGVWTGAPGKDGNIYWVKDNPAPAIPIAPPKNPGGSMPISPPIKDGSMPVSPPIKDGSMPVSPPIKPGGGGIPNPGEPLPTPILQPPIGSGQLPPQQPPITSSGPLPVVPTRPPEKPIQAPGLVPDPENALPLPVIPKPPIPGGGTRPLPLPSLPPGRTRRPFPHPFFPTPIFNDPFDPGTWGPRIPPPHKQMPGIGIRIPLPSIWDPLDPPPGYEMIK